MTFGPFKINEFSDSFKVDLSICLLHDIWSRRAFGAFFIFISS